MESFLIFNYCQSFSIQYFLRLKPYVPSIQSTKISIYICCVGFKNSLRFKNVIYSKYFSMENTFKKKNRHPRLHSMEQFALFSLLSCFSPRKKEDRRNTEKNCFKFYFGIRNQLMHINYPWAKNSHLINIYTVL